MAHARCPHVIAAHPCCRMATPAKYAPLARQLREGGAAAVDFSVLLSDLRNGSTAQQSLAIGALLALIDADPACRDAFAAADGVPTLVALLGDNGASVQQYAATALGSVCHSHRPNGAVAAAAGAVPALLRLARASGGDPDAQVRAVHALPWVVALGGDLGAGLALSRLRRQHGRRRGGGAVPPLARLLSSGDDDVRGAAASALATLSLDAGRAVPAILAAGALPPLVGLLRGGEDEAASAALTLHNVTVGGAACRAAVVEAGAVAPLVALLRCGSEAARDHALTALGNICATADAATPMAVVAAGAMPLLVAALGGGAEAARGACTALCNLAAVDAGCRAAVVAVGGVPPLVRLLGSSSNEGLQEEAAGALGNLSASGGAAVAGAGAVPPLLRALASSNSNLQFHVASALCNLALTGAGAAVEAASGKAALQRLAHGSGGDVLREAAIAIPTSDRMQAEEAAAAVGAALHQLLHAWVAWVAHFFSTAFAAAFWLERMGAGLAGAAVGAAQGLTRPLGLAGSFIAAGAGQPAPHRATPVLLPIAMAPSEEGEVAPAGQAPAEAPLPQLVKAPSEEAEVAAPPALDGPHAGGIEEAAHLLAPAPAERPRSVTVERLEAPKTPAPVSQTPPRPPITAERVEMAVAAVPAAPPAWRGEAPATALEPAPAAAEPAAPKGAAAGQVEEAAPLEEEAGLAPVGDVEAHGSEAAAVEGPAGTVAVAAHEAAPEGAAAALPTRADEPAQAEARAAEVQEEITVLEPPSGAGVAEARPAAAEAAAPPAASEVKAPAPAPSKVVSEAGLASHPLQPSPPGSAPGSPPGSPPGSAPVTPRSEGTAASGATPKKKKGRGPFHKLVKEMRKAFTPPDSPAA
eukprot:scaffold4.g4697.t1